MWLEPSPAISTLIDSAFSITWLLVSTSPELEITIPVPAPCPAPPYSVVTMLTRPGCTLPVTPETLALPFGRLTDDVSDGLVAGALFWAAGLVLFENKDPPRLALPSSAPPTRTIAMRATMAIPRRQCGCDGTGRSGGQGGAGGRGAVGYVGAVGYGEMLWPSVPKSWGAGAAVGCVGAAGCRGVGDGGGESSAACSRGLFSSPGSVIADLPHGGVCVLVSVDARGCEPPVRGDGSQLTISR